MHFEKVSFNQFIHDLREYTQLDETILDKSAKELYEQIRIPERSTMHSAGYDFFAPVRIYISGKCRCIVPSGIKCKFSDMEAQNWHLKLYIRSSVGIKKNVVLTNGTGVIDPDYYNNPDNEGDIFIALTNTSDIPAEFKAGDKIMQGILEVYGVTDDDLCSMVRAGGIGSTGR